MILHYAYAFANRYKDIESVTYSSSIHCSHLQSITLDYLCNCGLYTKYSNDSVHWYLFRKKSYYSLKNKYLYKIRVYVKHKSIWYYDVLYTFVFCFTFS